MTFRGENVPTLEKKVLLHKRKRYTTRHVASTRYAVLVGVPPPPIEVPGQDWRGTPIRA